MLFIERSTPSTNWKLLTLLFCLCIELGMAQVDTVYTKDYIDKSTKFAWMTFGGELLTLTGGEGDLQLNGTTERSTFGNTIIPRITIGGIHFWGHADFYVTFPLSFLAIQDQPNNYEELYNQQGIETGARIYPIKLKPNRISPFVGISFRGLTFRQEGVGENYAERAPTYDKMIVPLQAGLTYTTKKYLISASTYYQSKQRINHYIGPNQVGQIEFNPLSFNISVLKYWDADRHARNPKAINQFNAKHHILTKENRLSAWYVGIGPSAGLQLSKSPYLQANFPHLYQDFSGGFMPDITFGRYFHPVKTNVGLAYRTMSDQFKGFDDKLKINRHSFMLEGYRYLFNWLGFAPFAGVTASVERLHLTVNGNAYTETKPAVGFVLGWDIRVTETDINLLRTNLRWIPNLHLEVAGEKMMFDHLEFNFIQWVHFFGRKKAYDKYRKKG